MCDCFHLAFPNWHAASSGTRPGRRLQGPEAPTEDSICDEASQFTESERPRPQGSSPVEEYPETEKYSDSDKERDTEHDPHHKSGTRKKTKKSGLGSMFEKRSTPKMSKLKEVDSPESGLIVNTAKDGCAEGLIYGGGGKEGIFIKKVVPESPASKSLKVKEGDQILSATVYFDNMSYEDAIQILEHAQAYKLKLCLKRKPEMTEPEPATESHAIPEEDLYTPEMREQGKTKRRGEARISWPKFSSFGKGRKSRFIRSHSSSEADEQRKLELSPTTSDTESPIKTQDALKYKKKHKIKLAGLTKRGRISSSEDQDTDVPTTGQISSSIHQTQESDMLSPECLESPSGEMPEVYATEDLKVVKDLQLEQSNQTVTEALTTQHKVELISIDSTLKTADLTVALADQESPSGIKSPDGKKKKKERSELKMKILGKDKSHKKEAKAKSSPKRLKTLGASFELVDHPEMEKSDLIPSFESHTKPAEEPELDAKVEHDVSGVTVSQKYPQISEAKRQKGSEIKEKKETKKGQTFKLPKVTLGEVTTEEVRHDPYEKLAKSSDFRTQLPKREDIEIPGMEAASMKTTAKRKKEPKASYTGHNGDFQAETVQLSIDVDSVKEAVSKLPGYKLPKVDTSGMPIPEEITVIDANAQRISVKTPTKVVDTKTKHGANLAKFDVTSSPEIAKTRVKLPQFTTEDLLTESEVDFKNPEKEHETKQKQGSKEMKTETYKREDIIIPGKESLQETSNFQVHEADKTQGTGGIKFEYESDKKSKKAKLTMPCIGIAKPDIRIHDIGIDLPKQTISQQKGDVAKGEKTKFLQDGRMSKTEMVKGKGQTDGVVYEVMIPEIDGIEYIDSVDSSPATRDDGIRHTGSLQETRSEIKKAETEEHTVKLLQFGATSAEISVNVPDGDKAINTDGAETKTLEREGKGSKFKMPNLGISIPKVKGPKTDSSPSKTDVTVTLPVAKAEVQLPEAAEADVTLGSVDIYIPVEKEKHEMEIKHPDTEGEFDRQGGKFKMPKLGIAIPKVKGPEVDFSLSQKNEDVKLSETKMKIKYSDAELNTDIVGSSFDVKTTASEVEGKGSKFKMPNLGFSKPKVKGPKTDVSLTKKDIGVTLPEGNASVKLPKVDLGEVKVSPPDAITDVKIPEAAVKERLQEVHKTAVEVKTPEYEADIARHGGKFKMPTFGVKMTKTDIDVQLPGKKADVKLPKVDLGTDQSLSKKYVDVTPQTEIETKLTDAHEIDVRLGKAEVLILQERAEDEIEVHGSKFTLPKFGITMPKVKGPEFNIRLSNKDVNITTPEANISHPDVELEATSLKAEIKAPEIEVAAKDTKGSSSALKMTDLSFCMPKIKGPDINLSMPKKEANITLPATEPEVTHLESSDINIGHRGTDIFISDAKGEIKTTEVQVKPLQTDVELEGQGAKFKMPDFGITLPKLKGPDIDFGFSKKDANMAQPGAEIQGSPKIDVDMKSPECEDKIEGQGTKFKMPKLGITMPKVKGPDIDLKFSKKDVDVTLPEAKAEGKLPDVELEKPSAEVEIKAPEIKGVTKDTGRSPTKFMMPEFKLPKFGVGATSATAEVSDMEKGIKIQVADINIPEKVVEVNIEAPSIELKEPSVSLKTTGVEHEGKGSKFKLPSLGISVPQTKRPVTDLSLSKKDVDVALPEAKAEVKLPDVEFEKPSAEVEIEAPEVKVEKKDKKGSPSKFTMPTFKLPKFGIGTTSVTAEVPDVEKGIKIEGADISIPEKVVEVNIEAPSIELKEPSVSLKTTGAEHEGKGSKFKLPSLGISVPQSKGPDIDLSLSKKDVDVALPEAKAEVKLPDVEFEKPSAEVEIEAPEVKVEKKDKKGSPSKFTMPTFKLPKFGIGTTSVTAEVPDVEKGIKIEGADISIPEKVVEVNIEAPSIELKEPSVSLKTTGAEHEGKGSKFKLPSLGISVHQTKGPDIDLSLSKKDVDVALPEAKAEVKLPGVEFEKPSAEVEIEAPEIKVVTKDKKGSPSKYKMPTFKLPKFGVGTTSVTAEVPDMDKDVKIEGADIRIPAEILEVNIDAPSIELKEPSVSLKTTGAEHEGKGSKFKLPSLGISVPQTKRPDIDLSLSKKDVDVTLPEAKAEVKLPDVELEKPSAEVEIEAPEVKIEKKDKKGSPSKFTMPTFKLPKFGVGTTSVTAEVPDVKKGIKIEGADISIPEKVVEVNIEAPSIKLKEPSVSLKTTGAEHEGKGSKFKLPSLGISVPQTKGPDIDLSLSKKDVDVTLPEAKAEVKLPDVELEKPSAEVEIEAPEVKIEKKDKKGSPSKFTMPTFKLPKFGVGTTSVTAEVPDVEKGIKIEGADISIPEKVVEVNIEAPSIELKEPSVSLKTTGVEHEGKGSKFRLPSLGISVPQSKGPDIDLSLSKKDVDVTLPEAKAEVKLPDVELEKPSAKVEIEAPEIKVVTKDKKGSPSKYKMPTFKLPKFGIGTTGATAEVPDMDKDVKIEGADIRIPAEILEVNIEAPSIELKEPSVSLKTTGAEHEGKGSKFKLPSLGISVPQTKRPDIDLSLSKKDVDVTLPEAKAEVKLPGVELEKPSAEVEIEAPEVKVEKKEKKGSPSKFTMPTFKLPKFGIGTTSVTAEVPDVEKGIKIEGADISIPEKVVEVNIEAPSIELKEPSVSLKTTGAEHEGKGSKFKLPSLGISVPQSKGPDIDLSLSKKDVDVALPEAKADVKLPGVEFEKPSAEVEIEAPEIKVVTKDKKGSPSKYKMPTFKLPKFGVGTTSVTAEVPDMDKDVKIEGADIRIPAEILEVNIDAPSIELKEPSVSLKTTGAEHEGKGSKFKLPSLGISVPQTKGPDTDLSLSKKDVDVALPEAKAEVKLPDVELEKPSAEVEIEAPEVKVEKKDKKGSPSKFKMPTFKLPKFGIGSTAVTAEVPDVEKGIKIEGADISIPEKVVEVNIEAPSIELKEPSVSLKTTGAEHEGKGSKLKLPSLGISVPQSKGPDIDLSLSKKDVDVALPEAKAEVKLPDVELEKPSAEVEIEAPEVKVEKKDKKGSSSKFTMPTFKLPKFGVGTTSVTAEVPDMDNDVNIEGSEISIHEEVLEVNIDAPSIELKEPSVSLKTTGVEHEGKGSKFKLPGLGFSVPQVKGPDIDLSLSKKDVDVALPEAKAEVKLPDVELEKPSAEVEIEAPEVKVEKKEKKGSPSKFTMPTFKLPKFGIGTTSVTAEVPDVEKGIKIEGADISIPEKVVEVNIEAPSIELKEPSVSLKTTGAEHEGKGSKFKLPSLGISVPQTKGPDIDLSLSKKDVDVALPEAKAEVKLPDVELEKPSAKVEIEAPEVKVEKKEKKGSPSKFKMPTFKLPKFGVGTTSVTAEVPDMDKDVKIEGADIRIPEEVLEVNIEAPSIELKEPSVSLKTIGVEHEGKGSKFKLPSLGISVHQTKGPDIDLSLSKKDVDVTLPEAKAEVKLPDVELEKPSAEVEIEAPEINVEGKDKKGSPSKFKMPTFKLPKFGVGTTSVTAEVPDMDNDVKIEGSEISIPEEVLEVDIDAPSIKLKEPSVSLKTTGVEHEGKGSKFKLPGLGFSVPQVKGPDIDLNLSKKDVDVTLPEAKAEVKLPDVELEKPSAEVEIEAPEVKAEIKDKKGSPSKFTMPTLKLPKFGVGVTSVTAEVPDIDKGIKIEGADINIPEKVVEVNIDAPSIELKEPSISMKTTGATGKESKFKLPSLGISVPQTKGPDINLSLSKKDVDVTLPEAKAEIKLPDVELEKPSAEVEIEAPEIKVEQKEKKGSPSKFKIPTFKLPKFGFGTTSATAEVPDMDKGIKIEGADISIPEEVLEVNIEAPSIELKEPSFSLKTTGAEHEGKGSKFKLPSLGISVPQTKGPDIDLSLSKKDVDVTLPEAKAEVKLPDVELEKPSAEVEIEAPKIKVETKDKKGSPSKYKMPTFKLPKIGVSATGVTAEVPDMDKDVKIEGADIRIPEEVLEVNIDVPSIELKEPSVSLKTTGVEHEGKGSKFRLPSLGISVPQTKGPDIDLSLSKKDVDVTLPEAKAEVKLPDVELEKPSAEVEIEAPEVKVEKKDKKGSPSKFKMPTFKLPKFGIGSTSVTAEVPDMEKGIRVEGADISIPEKVVEVNIEAPSIELKEPSVSLKTTGVEHEGKGSKFKLPSLGISVPQTKGPDIDLSLSKKDVNVTLPEAKAEVKLPDVELEKPSAEVEIEAPEISIEIKDKKGSPSKFKMPTFKLPKFGIGTTSVTAEVSDMDKDVKIEGAEISIPEEVLEVNIEAPSIELEELSVSLKTTGAEHEGKRSKFKLPSLGISVPQTKGPDIDLSLSKKDVDVALPEAKAEVKLPDVELEKPSAEFKTKVPEIEIQEGNVEVSQSKLKMPTIMLQKFEAATSKVSMEVMDADKETKTEGGPSIDSKGVSVEVKAKGDEFEVSGSKFKMPNLGISMPKVKGPETDLSLSNKDVDVSLPESTAEVKRPHTEGKVTEGGVSVPEAPTIEVELKSKRPSWTFPKISFSRTGDKAPDVDVNTETPKADISTKAEVSVLDAEIKGPSMVQAPAAELDTNLKKRKFSLPRFSFSKSNIKEPELSDELPHTQVSVPEGEVKVKHPGVETKVPEQETEQGSTFKFPKFGIVQTKAKGPETDFNASKNNADIKFRELKADVKISEDEVKQSSSETEAKSKDAGGSPLKIKISPLKIPKFGSASYDVTTEAPKAGKVIDTDGSKPKEDVSASEKDLSVKVKMDDSKGKISDSETPKTETDDEGHGSPSKFKLPSFKMPNLSFSRPKPEEEILPGDTEDKDQLEIEDEAKGGGKSPKKTLTSFGEILKTIDVEFDVLKADNVEENLVVSKDIQRIDEPTGKQLKAKEKEAITTQDTSKSPERTGWFKFPKFGLSSPSERDEQKDKKSPVGGTGDEEISPTCSVQSSDAFADISSTITSEHADLSISPPTTVTVKYSDPNVATGLGETHSKIITSTTRAELISVEPNLAEKITILSSGISSSSEDTLRLDSGKIHVVTTNIQATPEAQHAKLLTDIEGELAGGLPLKSEADESASWTVEDSKSGNRTMFERHVVKKTSSERSESRETIVITKQITHVFDSSEPISGETASSIQRLRDSVHTEKMRFFDDAEK